MKYKKVSTKEVLDGGFGWKLIDMDEVTYFSYPENDRLYIENEFRRYIQSGTLLEFNGKRLYHYLTDPIYNWLNNEEPDGALTNRRLLKLIEEKQVHEQFREKVCVSEDAVSIATQD